MCDLCSDNPEVRKKAKERDKYQAQQLRELASEIENYEPHSQEAKSVAAKARHVIRYLVEEWM